MCVPVHAHTYIHTNIHSIWRTKDKFKKIHEEKKEMHYISILLYNVDFKDKDMSENGVILI